MVSEEYIYSISSIKCPGIDFFSKDCLPGIYLRPAFIGGRRLFIIVDEASAFPNQPTHMVSKYASKSYQKASVVKGHYVYKVIWTPTIDEELPLKSEDDNEHNEYAIAVMKNGKIVSHLPCKICVWSLVTTV